MAKVQTFRDAFLTLDLGRYPNSQNTGNISVSAGQLVMTIANGSDALLGTAVDLDLTESSLSVEVVTDLVDAGHFCELGIIKTAGVDEVSIFTFNNLICRTIVGTVETEVDLVSYNATAQRWRRIRESGGTLFWEVSPNGYAWTEQHSQAVPFDVSTVEVFVAAGNFSGAGPHVFRYDNLNMPDDTAGPGKRGWF